MKIEEWLVEADFNESRHEVQWLIDNMPPTDRADVALMYLHTRDAIKDLLEKEMEAVTVLALVDDVEG